MLSLLRLFKIIAFDGYVLPRVGTLHGGWSKLLLLRGYISIRIEPLEAGHARL